MSDQTSGICCGFRSHKLLRSLFWICLFVR